MKVFKAIFLIFLLITGIVVLIACQSTENGNEQENQEKTEKPIEVVTTIAQIGEPLQIIGGNKINVVSLMGPGVDPHLYEATQGDINKLEKAEIIFYNGLNLEGNMGEIFSKMKEKKETFAIAELIDKEKLLTDEEGVYDPHIWFDLDLWKEALNNATKKLKEYSPKNSDYFEENKNKYFNEIDTLKQEAKEKLASIPKEKRILVTAHDAFGYFGRMYDIEVVGLQGLSTEDEVGLSDIQSTIDLIIEKQVPSVFIESSVNQNSINAVIEGTAKAGLQIKLGGELFSDAMGEEGTVEGTYLGMYRHNVNTIYEGLTRGEK